MDVLVAAGILVVSYLIGAIPFGLIIVKLMSGIDVRTVASGRTGGTNAMRAAGPLAGVLTAVMDILKAASTVWIASAVTGNLWLHILAPLAAILGNNYSVFLLSRGPDGRLRTHGGAGGAAAGGGAVGLWPPALLIMLPIGFAVWYGIGYASITTLSIGLMIILIFGVRALLGLGPWQYAVYGILVELVLLWALRPNIKRLLDGTERRHGLPVLLEKRRQLRRQAYDAGKKS